MHGISVKHLCFAPHKIEKRDCHQLRPLRPQHNFSDGKLENSFNEINKLHQSLYYFTFMLNLLHTKFINSVYIEQWCGQRGNGIVSLILVMPHKICKYRSNPMPKPPVVQPPYFRRSKYHSRLPLLSGIDAFNDS